MNPAMKPVAVIAAMTSLVDRPRDRYVIVYPNMEVNADYEGYLVDVCRGLRRKVTREQDIDSTYTTTT